nr:T9SS type A sorting domain-containing protein [Gammaproteobacteria bacterium]NIW70634.1 T9SS type A sorting domain-containing protein [candidate division KSB1 bacterium]
LGVFISDDGGITWEPFSDGLPQAVLVLDLSISPLNRKLRVATHGNGAYERDLLEPSVGISRHGPQITEFRLDQNYPNPFNPTTKIRFGLPQATKVRLEVCNLIGQRVAVLVDEQKPAGFHEVNFDGRDMASGMYFYRIQTAEFTATKKMLMMK